VSYIYQSAFGLDLRRLRDRAISTIYSGNGDSENLI